MNSSPKWFRPVAVIALLWNLAGCAAYLADATLARADQRDESGAAGPLCRTPGLVRCGDRYCRLDWCSGMSRPDPAQELGNMVAPGFSPWCDGAGPLAVRLEWRCERGRCIGVRPSRPCTGRQRRSGRPRAQGLGARLALLGLTPTTHSKEEQWTGCQRLTGVWSSDSPSFFSSARLLRRPHRWPSPSRATSSSAASTTTLRTAGSCRARCTSSSRSPRSSPILIRLSCSPAEGRVD